MNYALDPADIITKAHSLEAERICFKTAGEFSFAPLDELAVSREVQRNLEGRVKYQKRTGGRWVDCSTYSFVLDIKGLFRDVANDAFRGVLRCTKEEFLAGISNHPKRFHTALRTILRKLHDAASKSFDPKLADRILTAFEGFPSDESDFFAYFLTTVKSQKFLFDNGLREVIESPDEHRIHTLADCLSTTGESLMSVGQSVAVGNLRAKLFSLIDRERAAHEFAKTLSTDAEGLIEFYYTDMGAHTYFASRDLVEGAAKSAADVVESIEPIDRKPADSSIAIVMSADPRFFRIYGHMMMFYAQQLPHLDFVFTLVGDHDEVSEVALAGREFSAALSQFNFSGQINNVRVFRAPIPDFVANDKTFYATSRFFAAAKLLDQYQGVYVTDIDLHFNDDPQQFIEWLRQRTFACSDNRGLYRLSPWRRHLAGNVFMRADIPQAFLSDLQEYIVTGLHKENSWMMDQNALTYAIERSFPDVDTSTAPFGRRPTSQPSFRAVWEASYASESLVK